MGLGCFLERDRSRDGSRNGEFEVGILQEEGKHRRDVDKRRDPTSWTRKQLINSLQHPVKCNLELGDTHVWQRYVVRRYIKVISQIRLPPRMSPLVIFPINQVQ
jgi:hypothetical protein